MLITCLAYLGGETSVCIKWVGFPNYDNKCDILEEQVSHDNLFYTNANLAQFFFFFTLCSPTRGSDADQDTEEHVRESW